jgi:hypothetical protein
MLSRARWATIAVLLTANLPIVASTLGVPWQSRHTEIVSYEQDKKFSIKAASTNPPKELDESIRKLLSNSTVQFFDPAGKLVCELWLARELPAQATAEQVKSGITYRELKETQLIGAVRFDQGWQDYRKQKIKPGVFTLRLGWQPQDGDHSGKSEFTEFLVLSAAARDQKPDLMAPKSLQEMSGKTLNTGHPGVFMLFPNSKPGKPVIESRPRDHWVVNVGCPVQANGVRGMLGFGITLVGEADD